MTFRSVLMLLVACSCLPQSTAGDQFFDSNGVKIRYVTEGKGEAIVLIHGWMGDSSMWGADWAGNTKLQGAEGFMVIALDCRGHGKSDKPHDAAQYGPEMAADVVRLLDHLNIKKAHLVGYSSGTFIASKVAATHPERVISVVYGGQAPLLAAATPSKPSDKPSKSDEVEVFANAVDQGKDLGVYLMAVWPADKPKLTEAQASAFAKLMFAGKDVKALALAGRSFGQLEVTEEQLKKCQAPILFIHGSKEADSSKKRAVLIQKLLGRGEIKVIPGADHMTTLTNPEFGKTIKGFIEVNKQK